MVRDARFAGSSIGSRERLHGLTEAVEQIGQNRRVEFVLGARDIVGAQHVFLHEIVVVLVSRAEEEGFWLLLYLHTTCHLRTIREH